MQRWTKSGGGACTTSCWTMAFRSPNGFGGRLMPTSRRRNLRGGKNRRGGGEYGKDEGRGIGELRDAGGSMKRLMMFLMFWTGLITAVYIWDAATLSWNAPPLTRTTATSSLPIRSTSSITPTRDRPHRDRGHRTPTPLIQTPSSPIRRRGKHFGTPIRRI